MKMNIQEAIRDLDSTQMNPFNGDAYRAWAIIRPIVEDWLKPATEARPVDMLLWCPRCNFQHVDAPSGEWLNPPHRSHLCAECGHIWRPADVATNGVASIQTRGDRDGSTMPRIASGYPPPCEHDFSDPLLCKKCGLMRTKLQEIEAQAPEATAIEIKPGARYILCPDGRPSMDQLADLERWLLLAGFENVTVLPGGHVKLYKIV